MVEEVKLHEGGPSPGAPPGKGPLQAEAMTGKDGCRPHGLIRAGDLPGPMSMRLLVSAHVLAMLDPTCAYLVEDAAGIFGRADIVEPLIPYGAAACCRLALWIWTGGNFPDELDIVSNSHFRAPVHGRIIQVHNRRLPTDHLMKLGRLWATSPMWTACEIACLDQVICNGEDRMACLHELMERYQVSPLDCLDLLQKNPRWPGHAVGVGTLSVLKGLL